MKFSFAFLSILVLHLLVGCSLPDLTGPCGESKNQEYVVKGDFLLDHGERIAFAPKCYYDPASPNLKCGLAVLGVETYKTIAQSRGNMNCPGVSRGVVFNYDSTDFDKLFITTSDGATKPLFSYSYSKTAYRVYYNNNSAYDIPKLDYYDSFSYLNKVKPEQMQMNLIECDSLGVIDFSIKDAKGTQIHMEYDLSYFIEKLQTALKISDDGLHISNGDRYFYRTEQCFYREVEMSNTLVYNTNIVAISHMDNCLKQCLDCNGEIPVVRIMYSLPSGLTSLNFTYPSLVLTCKSDPEIQDSVPQIFTIGGYKEDYCKAIRVLPYVDGVSASECKSGEINCSSQLPMGNVVYKPSLK